MLAPFPIVCFPNLKKMTGNFPSPAVLIEVLHQLKEPVVFKNRLKGDSWDRIPWTPQQLSERYGKTCLSFRIVPKDYKGIAWEGSAKYVEASLNQFMEWLNGPVKNNPFEKFKPLEEWAYSGYNHMIQTFGEYDDIVQAVDWSTFGYYEMPGRNSAFWIGSGGSYTPCHYDTYGCNLVAQIQGRKKWVLFPPDDSPYMYSTRIPYEESSVYSSVNILEPDFKDHPLFKFSHPHVVVLEPGDVLFVPHKWWHFVQSLEVSMSVNTWMKMDIDNETHLEEAVARAMMTSLISYFEPEGDSWVNTHEELVSPEETLKYVTTSLHKLKEQTKNTESKLSTKLAKTFSPSDVHSGVCDGSLRSILQHEDIYFVPPVHFSQWLGCDIEVSSPSSKHTVNRRKIVDCFSHPDVISLICKMLRDA